jgi:hypothetical protein
LNDDRARLQSMRADHARIALEEEIEHSGASVQQKAYMRQKLAHLWQLVKVKTEVSR